jgi:serpin B
MKRFLIGLLAAAALGVVARAENKTGLEADQIRAVKGNTAFALDLYAKLRTEDGNLFFSPYSISTALAMTRAGARGDTAAEMDKVLHFTLSQDRLHPAFAALMKQVNGDPSDKKRGYQLSTANALWGQKGFPFKDDFLKLVNDDYDGGLNDVDFKGATEDARQTINAWVEKQTQDKIKELLLRGVLSVDTRLVLTNAIYFKGDWASQFKKDRTFDSAFHITADKSATVPMMNQEGEFRYSYSPEMQALELPYAGKGLSMVVLLPQKVDGLADLENNLSAEKLDLWLGRLAKVRDLEVSLPKFKATSQFSLKAQLSGMGMPTAFSNGADFSRMADAHLFISAVIHKAYIDVNEEGTEAAAATAVVVDGDSAPPRFWADHPFLFLIRDNRSGSVLFMGRVTDPTK